MKGHSRPSATGSRPPRPCPPPRGLGVTDKEKYVSPVKRDQSGSRADLCPCCGGAAAPDHQCSKEVHDVLGDELQIPDVLHSELLVEKSPVEPGLELHLVLPRTIWSEPPAGKVPWCRLCKYNCTCSWYTLESGHWSLHGQGRPR